MTDLSTATPIPGFAAPARPIRVAFVVHVMQVAGAEVLVRETIRRLGPALRPTIFCLDRIGQIGEELQSDGVDVVSFDRRPGRDLRVSKRIAAAARERSIEILHAHQYTPYFYAALAKPFIAPKPKLILTEHGRHYPDHVSRPRRVLNRWFLSRFADAVNACCRFSANALAETDGFRNRPIDIIENGIDVERYGPPSDRAGLRRQLGLDPDGRYVINVARHHPVKDQAMLLRGFAEAARACPAARLLMVGDGPLRGDLETQARELGMADRVRFLGIRSDVAMWLGAADVFALTSVSEAASLTLLEAMATGLPVVVTDVGGNPEIVREGIDGLRVPRGDAAACGRALAQLLTDPERAAQLGRHGRERAQERYRLDRTINDYHRLYRTLLGRTQEQRIDERVRTAQPVES